MSRNQWNDLVSNTERPMENKAIQGEYPPASTYKIVTAIAGLEEGVIDESTTVYCPGHYKYGNRVFRCWKKGGHGTVNVVKALEESCDVFFYQVGQKLGIDRLAWYAKACGLGAVTSVGLDKEAAGIVPSTAWKRKRLNAPWHRGETLSVAIGQGYNLATPLQMACLTAAVANGGTRYRPLFLKEVRSAENALLLNSEAEPVGRLPLGERTLGLVREGLWRVVNGRRGTARASKIAGIEMCGKTGTAQVVGRKAGGPRRDEDIPDRFKAHAWFVAYAPAQQPKIAMVILLEHGEHGSSAAPIARDLIAFYLEHERKRPGLVAQHSGSGQAPAGATP
jgi:penicillin-binding protein 2